MLALLAGAALPALAEPPEHSPAGRVAAEEAFFPPWQGGSNNDAANKGLDFTVPPVDTMVDFHGNLTDIALAIYASGNNFFAYKKLVDLFGEKYPDWKGRIFYETLPPGLLLKQLQNGGTITSGNLTFTVKPDVMMAEKTASETWVKQGFLVDPVVPFATNNLAIMVRSGNPEHIKGLEDLGKPGIVLAMPNPAWEGVAGQITTALQKAGGDALANAVYDRKVEDGTTILTRIHHRQTPLWLMQGRVQAGVTWRSEALFQEQTGHPIEHVDIPSEQNAVATYSAAMAAGAPHPYVAKAWLDFIKSDEAFAVLEGYGFKRYAP
jgi:ABC-type molybdate transport system substrate-binding protein